jgi:ribosomal protein L37AE/L43A
MALSDQDEDSNESSAAKGPPIVTERDIVFNCDRCGGQLVVDRDGEGIEVQCSHCGHLLVIPRYQPPPAAEPAPAPAKTSPAPLEHRFDFSGFSGYQLGRRIEELRHQLKENRSQDTELRGHVNRATMELHRLQLRLQKLHERQVEIEAEINAARQHVATR